MKDTERRDALAWETTETELSFEVGQDDVPIFFDEPDKASTDALQGADPVALPEGSDITWLQNRRFFAQRLGEELARASRLGGPLSIVLLEVCGIDHIRAGVSEVLVQLAWESLRRCLREYDVCCHISPHEMRVILPGASADDCASVIARIRQRADAERKPTCPAPQICAGTATWPQQGSGMLMLIDQAQLALRDDRRRLLAGEVEIGAVPPSMVESRRGAEVHPTSVWFEGFPHQVQVEAVQTPNGVRLRMPLRFLRLGSTVQFDLEQQNHAGVLAEAVLGKTNAIPMLFLDVVAGT
jgi:diguanylate cyclase (GGDEF)-like protein